MLGQRHRRGALFGCDREVALSICANETLNKSTVHGEVSNHGLLMLNNP